MTEVKYSVSAFCPISGGRLSGGVMELDELYDTRDEALEALGDVVEFELSDLDGLYFEEHTQRYQIEAAALSIDHFHPDEDGHCHTPFKVEWFTTNYETRDREEIEDWHKARSVNEKVLDEWEIDHAKEWSNKEDGQ